MRSAEMFVNVLWNDWVRAFDSPTFAVTFSNWLREAVAFSARNVSSSVVSCHNTNTGEEEEEATRLPPCFQSLWIIHQPVSVTHLLSQFSQSCEDFHFLLRELIPRQFTDDHVSVHLHRASHDICPTRVHDTVNADTRNHVCERPNLRQPGSQLSWLLLSKEPNHLRGFECLADGRLDRLDDTWNTSVSTVWSESKTLWRDCIPATAFVLACSGVPRKWRRENSDPVTVSCTPKPWCCCYGNDLPASGNVWILP